MSVSLQGKVVLITGAASGIGRATAAACAEAGARVVATDLKVPDVAAFGADAIGLALDVSSAEAAQAAVAAALQETGHIDGLVNCAGVEGRGSLLDIDYAYVQRIHGVHLGGTFNVTKAVMPGMVAAKRGAIVNVGSIYGMNGGSGSLAYNTAKAAILQFTRCLAADYSPRGVRVNSVSPGYIDTPMTDMLRDERAAAFRRKFIEMHLLKRPGQSEEVARAIRFLLSDEASFITGANLPVDGGFSAADIVLP
jgi:NAD(P)-dependent dehydrogenase (short-subunit alcohol dehydrogenase family)